MLLWLDYMETRCQDGLVVREETGGWCLGEWCAPDLQLPAPFVNTYFYLKAIHILLEIASQFDLQLPVKQLKQRWAVSLQALNTHYLDQETGSYCDGVNGADSFALDLGLGNPTLLIKRYGDSEVFDTGIFGTYLVLKGLFDHQAPEVAWRLLTNRGSASFYKMQMAGATTLWENWDGSESHNHPMFGSIVRLLFEEILGIRQKRGTVGFGEIEIAPAILKQLDWAKGYLKTDSGTVWVSVKKDASGNRICEHRISKD